MKKRRNTNTAPGANKARGGHPTHTVSKGKGRGKTGGPSKNYFAPTPPEGPTVNPRRAGERSNDTLAKGGKPKVKQSQEGRGASIGSQNFSAPQKMKQSPTNHMKMQTAKPTLAAPPKPPQLDVMPTPMELATLAATLRPDFKPLDAIKTAMEFFLEAKLFVHELPASEDDLIRTYGSEARRMALRARPLEKIRQEVLTLNPASKASDEVRDFLAANGVNWKTSRAVIENILHYGNEAAKLWPFQIDIETELENFRQESGELLIPRVILQGIVDSEKARRKVSATKGAETKRSKPAKAKPLKAGRRSK